MSKTFSYRQHETCELFHKVVNLSPPIKDCQERWPALFTEEWVSYISVGVIF